LALGGSVRSSGLRPVVIFDFRQRDRHVLFAIGEHIVQDFRRLLDFGEPIEGEGASMRAATSSISSGFVSATMSSRSTARLGKVCAQPRRLQKPGKFSK
jgi:hypothetical protein